MGDSVPAGGRDGVERHLQTCPLARHAGFSASNLLAVRSFWWIRFTYSLYLALLNPLIRCHLKWQHSGWLLLGRFAPTGSRAGISGLRAFPHESRREVETEGA